jgi:nucleoside-diphosphate-sugar epimerase
MARLLVFGGSRMLGPLVVGGACARGWDVTVANRGSEPPEGFPDAVRHARVDRADAAGVEALLADPPDAIVDLSCYRPEWAVNALSALAGWRGRYVLMSSGAVYAESAVLPIDERVPATGRPLWGEYGANKVRIERLFLEPRVTADVATLRPPYIVGVEDFMGRLPFVFDRVAAGVPVLLPDSGQACIQLVAAEDVAEATLRLLTKPLGAERAFNVGPPRFVTLESLVRLCARALGGGEPDVVRVPLSEAGLTDSPFSWDDAFFPFADRHYVLDARRLEQAVGMTSYEPLEQLIERLARAHQSAAAGGQESIEAPSEARLRSSRGLPGLATRRAAHA